MDHFLEELLTKGEKTCFGTFDFILFADGGCGRTM